MNKQNVVLISMDEVRPDHLSCYGYNRINTNNIDIIADQGVLFEECVASADFTPICHASVFTGLNPDKHGVRDPFCALPKNTMAETLKNEGYVTAGFVGNSFLGSQHGFNKGFDFWVEPTGEEEEAWEVQKYPGEEEREKFYLGKLWMKDMFDWLKDNYANPFFMFGHYFHCHEAAERALLSKNMIEEGKLSEFGYYDAKIKLMDEILFGPLITNLKEYGVFDNTIFIIISDHGTTLAEHPYWPLPWREIAYPAHIAMYDTDIRTALIMKSNKLPRGKRVKGMVRHIDILPTLLELLDIQRDEIEVDGFSLLPFVEKGKAEGLIAYAEDLFEKRGPGAIQGIRTDRYKFWRNLTTGEEEFYNLESDLLEQNNIIDKVARQKPEMLKEWRQKMTSMLWEKTKSETVAVRGKEEREKIKARMRALGYME